MHEFLTIAGALLTALVSYFALNKLVFYTKNEIDEKFQEKDKDSDKRVEMISLKMDSQSNDLKNNLAQTKDRMFEKLLEAERQNNKDRENLAEKLAQTKDSFEACNKAMLSAISDIKQDEKQLNSHFITLINTMKDEIKNDYINRYNDLMKLIGTKANVQDFDRLENKFDKVTETITELKTIVQMQLEENKNRDYGRKTLN